MFLFNKAARKAAVKPYNIHLLYSIYINQPCTWVTGVKQLISVKRVWSANIYNKRIKELIELNYIKRDSGLYYLTPLGVSILKAVETKLRKERTDK